MNVGRGQKHVDTGTGGVFQSLPCAFDVGAAGASQAGDDWTSYDGRNRLDGFEIAIRRDGEAGLDHVHTQAVELVRHPQLFLMVHAAAGRLFSVAQSGVENRDSGSLRAHGSPLQKTDVLCYGAAGEKQNL